MNTMFDEHRFTICTISFGHAHYLSLNWNVSEQLNGAEWQRVDWLTAENAPADVANRITSDTKHFQIFPGSSNTALGASHHHAEALNALLAEVKTRFVLVLDPDFFILRPNWLTEIEAHMRKQELAFFGVQWHPRYVDCYRYFPAVHCMFIDQARVPLRELDFRPILENDSAQKATSNAQAPGSFLASIMEKFQFKHRRRRSWDTGTRIFERFGNDPQIKSEYVTAVYRLPSGWIDEGNPFTLKSRMLELVLPDSLCYLPKHGDSYSQRGFIERGLSAMDLPTLWEEHIWKDAAFGLHIRRSFASNKRDPLSEFDLCERFVDDYLSSPQLNFHTTRD
ncbi:MAG: hypothetical protein V4568_05515 [Pseudomonadota bacterium]